MHRCVFTLTASVEVIINRKPNHTHNCVIIFVFLFNLLDKRYPADATVELVFSTSPEQKRGADDVISSPTSSFITGNTQSHLRAL